MIAEVLMAPILAPKDIEAGESAYIRVQNFRKNLKYDLITFVMVSCMALVIFAIELYDCLKHGSHYSSQFHDLFIMIMATSGISVGRTGIINRQKKDLELLQELEQRYGCENLPWVQMEEHLNKVKELKRVQFS